MSAIDNTNEKADDLSEVVDEKRRRFINKLDSVFSVIVDRLNPILVKETRQALKSRQFILTFSLLLICGWGWSFFGTILQMPAIYYSPMGEFMLAGYYCILAIPTLIIVPFSAFRSLATERDDGTYELLSITTLSSRQIITGKLSSAVVQMIVYYSALAPCIVFTYMLRGVNIFAVLILLFYTFVVAVLFSAIGLMLAGISRQRNVQMVMTLILLIALSITTFGWLAAFMEGIDRVGLDGMIRYDFTEFWVGSLAFLSLYVSYFAIVVLVAAAQISFSSDNRSTKIRIAMFVQTVCYIGWLAVFWFYFSEWELLAVGFMLAVFHWYVYAVFLTGESGQLSPRVKRSLPQSFAGRAFLTWFNPGSGTGYIFACIQVGILATCVLAGYWIKESFGVPISRLTMSRPAPPDAYYLPIVLCEYFVLYVGIGRLLLLLIPNRWRQGFMLPLMIHIGVIVSACLIPVAIQNLSRFNYSFGYTPLQYSNWAWTIDQIMSRRITGNSELPFVLGLFAILIFVINLILTAREIESVRLETPQRVQEDIEQTELSKVSIES